MQKDQILTIPQAAEEAGITTRMLFYYINAGRGPATFPIGKRLFTNLSDMQNWKPTKLSVGRKKKPA